MGLTGYSDSSKAAGTGFVILQSCEEILPVKVGPEFFCHMNFCVAQLPEEKIGNPHLAGGADQQVGVGDSCGVQARFEDLRGDGVIRVAELSLQALPKLRGDGVLRVLN